MKKFLIIFLIFSTINSWADLKTKLALISKSSGKEYLSQRAEFLEKPGAAEYLKEQFLKKKGKDYLVSALYLRTAESVILEFYDKNKPVYFSNAPNENRLPHLKQAFSDIFKLNVKEVDIIDSKVFYKQHFRNAWKPFFPHSSISLYANGINKVLKKKYSPNHLFFSLMCLEFERIFHNTELLNDMERNIHIQEFGYTIFQEPLVYEKEDTSQLKINKEVISAYIDQVLTNKDLSVECRIALTHLILPHKIAYESLFSFDPGILKDNFPNSLSEESLLDLYEEGSKKIPNLNFWITKIFRPIFLKRITNDDVEQIKMEWPIKNVHLKELISKTIKAEEYKKFCATTYKAKNFYHFHKQKEYSSLYSTEKAKIFYRIFYVKKNTFK